MFDLDYPGPNDPIPDVGEVFGDDYWSNETGVHGLILMYRFPTLCPRDIVIMFNWQDAVRDIPGFN